MTTSAAGRASKWLKIGLGSIGVAAFVAMYFVALNPPFKRWPFEHTSMLSVHLLLEMVAIVVAMLIVTAAWYAFEHDSARAGGVIIAGLVIVASCDAVHSLTYDGMPELLGEAGTPRAIYFWLMGRSAEVLTLLLVALSPATRLARAPALALGVALSALLIWFGSFHLDLFPTTFVRGVGVTPFKARFEYALSGANFAAAWLLWRRAQASGQSQFALMSTSALVMGVGEFAFSSYVTPSDFQNVFGHLYKVAAYMLLYRATFVVSFHAPYEALRASEARARENELRIRSLGDNLPNCVVYQVVREVHGKRHFSHVSEGVLQVNGLAAADVLSNARLIYDQIVPEDRPALAAAEEHSARNLSLFDQTVRLRRADGELRWMHLFSRPRALDDGRIVWDGVQFDVTERRLAEDERARLEIQLLESQKLEAIGTLAGGIAHDFNNVLGAIIGNLALAHDEIKAGLHEQATRSLEQVERAARRARDLVQKILTFSRRRPPQRSCQAVRPVVEDCIALLRATIPAGVAFEVQLDERPAYAMVDTSELQQVIMNLGTNAWQALQGQPGVIQIGLDRRHLGAEADGPALPPGDYVHLWVRDSGCGIDEATQRRIFEPFFTTKLADGGTGLGLSVVHGIVRSHGGAVTLGSAPGTGSVFHVYLPETPETAITPPSPAGPLQPVRRTHVAYIDDDEVMGLMVERLLAREGHEVTVFRDPALALAAIAQAGDRFGAIVTDYNMPGLSGLDVARSVRDLAPALPVIVSSGDLSDELRARAPQCGVKRLIEKQNTLEDLPAALYEVLLAHERDSAAATQGAEPRGATVGPR